MSHRALGPQFSRPGGRRSPVNMSRTVAPGKMPTQEMSDQSLEGLSQSCPDCKSEPFQPCHYDCSSRWD